MLNFGVWYPYPLNVFQGGWGWLGWLGLGNFPEAPEEARDKTFEAQTNGADDQHFWQRKLNNGAKRWVFVWLEDDFNFLCGGFKYVLFSPPIWGRFPI